MQSIISGVTIDISSIIRTSKRSMTEKICQFGRNISSGLRTRGGKLKKECIELGYNYIELWECKWIKTINAINYIKKLWKFKKIK